MKMRILIVDDEPGIFDSLSHLLSEDGFEVAWAATAEEFRTLAFKFEPHLIVLDIHLRGHNGTEVHKQLLKEGLDRKLPVLFLSGLLPDAPAMPLTPGRNYALHSKPFRYDDLLRDIQFLIRQNAA
jgi:DNA-binding response OmpR family regulator